MNKYNNIMTAELEKSLRKERVLTKFIKNYKRTNKQADSLLSSFLFYRSIEGIHFWETIAINIGEKI